MSQVAGRTLTDVVASSFEGRRPAALSLVPQAEVLVLTAQAMARRFGQGGRLLALGNGSSWTDAHHVAVEFVHPVIVGMRSLPAMALSPVVDLSDPAGMFVHPLRTLARPTDMALVLALEQGDASLVRALHLARELSLLTVALTGPGSTLPADHVIRIESPDPLIVKEVQVTAYHILWELVHLYRE